MLLVLECIKYMFMYFQQFNSKRAEIFTFKATFLPHLPPPPFEKTLFRMTLLSLAF